MWRLLGGGFKHFLCSPQTLGKWPNLTIMFQRGWFNHQLDEYAAMLKIYGSNWAPFCRGQLGSNIPCKWDDDPHFLGVSNYTTVIQLWDTETCKNPAGQQQPFNGSIHVTHTQEEPFTIGRGALFRFGLVLSWQRQPVTTNQCWIRGKHHPPKQRPT